MSPDPSVADEGGTSNLNTAGNQIVYFHGENVGRASADIIDEVFATYGPTGVEYEASECKIVVPYSLAKCTTTVGVGTNHKWTVTVRAKYAPSKNASYFVASPAPESQCVGRGCLLKLFKGKRNDAIAITNWYVATTPWEGVSKTSGKCMIDAAVNKHTFDTQATYLLPHLADGRRWEPFSGNGAKEVIYQGLHMASWRSKCGIRRDYADLDCHYKRKKYGGRLDMFYSYVATHLCSDRPQAIDFGLGADDSFEMWINGVAVLKKNSCQAPNLNQWKFSHTLSVGVNTIVMKLIDYHGLNGWILTLRKMYPGLSVVRDPSDCFRPTATYSIDGSTMTSQMTSYSQPVITGLQLKDKSNNDLSAMETIGGNILSIFGTNFGPLSIEFRHENIRYVRLQADASGVHYLQLSQVTVTDRNGNNVAQGKTCTHSNGYPDSSGNCANALDGNAVLKAHPGEYQSAESSGAWWMVNLESGTDVVSVTVHNRADCCQHRMDGTAVQLLDENLNVIKSLVLDGRDVQTLTFQTASGTGTGSFNGVVTYGPAETESTKYVATDCFVHTANTVIQCKTTRGIGPSHKVVVRASGHKSALSELTIGYASPTINRIYSDVGDIEALPTSGNIAVYINGTNFPVTDGEAQLAVTYGATGTEFAAKNCRVSFPGKSLLCVTTEGYGAGPHRWKVEIDGVASPLSEDTSSHKAPAITHLRGPGAMESNTRGGEVIFLHGSGLFGTVINVTYGPSGKEYSATYCEVVSAHAVVKCLSAEGTGSNHLYSIAVNGLESESLFRSPSGYAPPTLNNVLGTGAINALSGGGEQVHLVGTNFGPMSSKSTVNATYTDTHEGLTYSANRCVRTVDHTQITCYTSAGSGKELKWTVYVDGLPSRAPSSSFLRPEIGSVGVSTTVKISQFSRRARRLLQNSISSTSLLTNASTEGGDRFQIFGTNFGPPRFLPKNSVSYGPTGSEYIATDCIVTSIASNISTTTIQSCILRNNWLFETEIAGRTQSNLLTTIADGIYESGTSVHSLDTLRTLTEEQLLALCPDPKGSMVQGTPGVISCRTNVGGGKDLFVIVNIGGQTSIPVSSATLSYAPPTVAGLNPASANTGDNVIIHLVGSQFGPSSIAKVYFDGIEVTYTSQTSHFELSFMAPATGVGILKSIEVEVAGQTSNSIVFSYNAPVVEFVTSDSEEVGHLEILGRSFGASNDTGVVSVGKSDCSVISWTHNRIRCITTIQTGILTVEVGGQSSAEFDFNLQQLTPDYNPTLTALSSYSGLANGGYEITAYGVNLGPIDGVSTELYFGSRLCIRQSANDTVSDISTSVTCTVPSASGIVEVYAIAGMKKSNSYQFTFIAPTISDLISTGKSTFGGHLVTVVGNNFGDQGIVYWNDAKVIPDVGAVPRTVSSGITVDGNKIICASGCTFKSFHEPCADTFCTACKYAIKSLCSIESHSIVCKTCMSGLGSTSEVTYANNGCETAVYGILGTCQINGQKLSNLIVTSYNNTVIQLILPHGQGTTNAVQVEVEGAVRSNTYQFAFEPPTITGATTTHGPTIGNTIVVINGANFGETQTVKLGSFPCIVLSSTHDRISCLSKPGEGRALPIRVFAGDQEGTNLLHVFNYDAPLLQAISPNFGSTTGNYSVRLNGTNLGIHAKVFIGHKQCHTLAQSHTHIDCLAPEGEGTGHAMYVIVSGQRSNSITWNYELPKLRVISPNPIDAKNGATVTVEGSNFGVEQDDIEITFGGHACGNAERIIAENKPGMFPLFKCKVEPIDAIVGPAEVYMRVSKQILQTTVEDAMISFACPFNTFGSTGEKCEDCPIGAFCAGGVSEPAALAGYWKTGRSTFVQCLPSSACTGNNTCAEGYRGEMCAQCAERNYRVDLSCHRCTDRSKLKLAMFVLSVLFLVSVVMTLSEFEIKLVTVNMIMDFVQVMAVCSAYYLDWPSMSQYIIEGSRLVLFNLENVEPECMYDEWTYETGYWALETLPITFLIALWLMSHIFHCMRAGSKAIQNGKVHRKGVKRTIRLKDPNKISSEKKLDLTRNSEAVESAGNTDQEYHRKYIPLWRRGITDHAWGAYFLLCYYLYFPLTWKAWEPWDCTPYKVSNTTTIFTMDADPTEQCYGSKYGTYWNRLGPISIMFGMFYSLALPLYMVYIFVQYKNPIKKDQLKREVSGTEGQSWRRDLAAIRLQTQFRGHVARSGYGTGHHYSRHNVSYNTVLVRKHYGKLYEDFTPNLYFWRLVIMVRKTLLVVTVFIPSTAPSFQAACALLILFFFFVLHVKYRPYLKRHSMPGQGENAGSGKIIGVGSSHAKASTAIAPMRPERTATGEAKSKRAKMRWKTAMMVARTEVRWHKQTASHLKDAMAWLFDYNSLEMLALACNIIILLFGLMMKTYSPSIPILGYFQTSEDSVREYIMLALDNGVVLLFFIPLAILIASVLLDMERNVKYYYRHKAFEDMQLAKGRKLSAAEEATHIKQWRQDEEKKTEDDIRRINAEYDAGVARENSKYSARHDELEDLLKVTMSRRVKIEEAVRRIDQKIPVDADEARMLRKEKQQLELSLEDLDVENDGLTDQLNGLMVDFRNSKMKLHEEAERSKQERRAKMKQRLEERLRRQNRNLGAINAANPVQLQCRVLVTHNRFNETISIHEQAKIAEAMLTHRLGGKSTLYENHKQEMDRLNDKHEEEKESLLDKHDAHVDKLQGNLQDLQADKMLNEDQIRVLEEAQIRQRNALLQELGQEKYDAHMAVLARIKARKAHEAKDKISLKNRAEEEGWDKNRLDAAAKAITEAAAKDVKDLTDKITGDNISAHARLMERLARIKAKEALTVRTLEQSGRQSAAAIASVHEATAKEIADILEKNKCDDEDITPEMMKSLYELKLQEHDAIDHLRKSNQGQSSEDLERKVKMIKDRSSVEAAALSAQMQKNQEEKSKRLMARLAARKQKEAIEITGAINLAQITGKSKEDVQAEIQAIKEKSNKDTERLMKDLGMKADKKHQKLMDRLASRKAKEIHRIEEIRQNAQEEGKSQTEITREIDEVKIAAEKDTEVLLDALATRAAAQKEKQSNKVVRALNKLADIAVTQDDMEDKLKHLENKEADIENHIADLQSNHEDSITALHTKIKKERNGQADALQARLAARRQEARKSGNKTRRAQIEMETQAIQDLAEAAEERERAEENLATINKEYDKHQEELAKHMATEHESQKQALQKRLKNRRKALAAKGKNSGVDEDMSPRHLNALLEMKGRLIQDCLKRAYGRMSKGGLTSEQQLKAVLQDIQRVAASSGIAKREIAKPEKPNVIGSVETPKTESE